MTLLVPGQMGECFVIIWFWNCSKYVFLDQFLQVLLNLNEADPAPPMGRCVLLQLWTLEETLGMKRYRNQERLRVIWSSSGCRFLKTFPEKFLTEQQMFWNDLWGFREVCGKVLRSPATLDSWFWFWNHTAGSQNRL